VLRVHLPRWTPLAALPTETIALHSASLAMHREGVIHHGLRDLGVRRVVSLQLLVLWHLLVLLSCACGDDPALVLARQVARGGRVT